MLTISPSSSLPRPHPHLRRALPSHISHNHTRRRSLSHPILVDLPVGNVTAVPLRSHTEDDEEEESGEDDDIAVQPESRQRLAAFVSKETSGESSDEDDELDLDDDGDSSSSVSSSGSTPQLKPVDKRTVTFHTNATHPPLTSLLPPSSAAPVVHRKVVKPSIRQHKASPHHYSGHQSASKTHAVRMHRRKPHTVDSTVQLLPEDSQPAIHSQAVAGASDLVAASDLPTVSVASVDVSSDKAAPLVPRSSATRYALLMAILRRSDGRDKIIRTAFFGTNHLRALVHTIHNQLTHNKRLFTMLSIPSSSTSPLLFRLLSFAASFCQSADVHLGHVNELLGAARQLLRFGRWMYDLESLSEAWQEWKKCSANVDGKQQSSERTIERATAMLELINAFLSVIIDFADDVEWLAEHRILPSSLASPAGFTSAILWLASVCIDIPFTLHTLSALSKSDSAVNECRAEQLSLVRYTGDLLYSGSLVAEHMGWSSDNDDARWRIGDSGGLVSALVSLYKLSRSESLHRSVH